MPRAASVWGSLGFFCAFVARRGPELAGDDLVDGRLQLADGNGVVEPDVAGELRSSLPSRPARRPLAIGQCAAGRAGIVGHGVEHVGRAAVVRFERAAAGGQLGLGRDDAVQHAGRLVAEATPNMLLKASTRAAVERRPLRRG